MRLIQAEFQPAKSLRKPDSMSETTSAERVFAILEMFGRERRPLTLKALSEYCRIPNSTCHALVQTLIKRGYLYQFGPRKDLYPTRKLYDIGAVIVANDMLLQRLKPIMEDLREETQETVILGKRQRDDIVYLEVLESPQTIRYSASVGASKPLHSTCIGKAILADLKPEVIRQWWESHNPQQITKDTVASYARLMDSLEAGLKAGYFTTRGENVPDVTAIAIPIDINNERFGLAIAGPTHRMDRNFDAIVQSLLNVKTELRAQGLSDHDAEPALPRSARG